VSDRLDCYTFGRRLLELNDLDPVYALLWESGWDATLRDRWLVAYWAFYHVGTASWVADGKGWDGYWSRMMTAAGSKDYPRSAERRHFRGAAALKGVEYLRGRGVDGLFNDLLNAGPTAQDVIAAAGRWTMFGPWIAFKVADMLERLDVRPVLFDVGTAFYDGSPVEGAKLLWAMEHSPGPSPNPALDVAPPMPPPNKETVTAWACGRILGEMTGFMAPPRYERPLGVQEAETVCCKWKSYWGGHYHAGEDVSACRRALGWASARRSGLAQDLYRAGKRGGLW
jgi:hypothetical protein